MFARVGRSLDGVFDGVPEGGRKAAHCGKETGFVVWASTKQSIEQIVQFWVWSVRRQMKPKFFVKPGLHFRYILWQLSRDRYATEDSRI